MKRIIICILAILSLSIVANAQPWLFPGKKKAKKDTTTKVVVKDSVALPTINDTSILSLGDSSLVADIFVRDIPQIINVSILLPVSSNGRASGNFFIDYYSGALLAARELGMLGVKMNVNIYDTDDFASSVDDEIISTSDVIIGPVKCQEIAQLASRHPDKYIISPIEPKAESLIDSLNLIQAPSSWMRQTEDMVKWLHEDKMPEDRIVVIQEDYPSGVSEKRAYLMDCLNRLGLNYIVVQQSKLSDLNNLGTIRCVLSDGPNDFICKTINSLATLSEKKNIVLYSTSAVRSLNGINATSLFMCRTRMTAAYHIDYDSNETMQFIRDYRALFRNEPSSFAYSGYDTMLYFVNMCRNHGRQWHKKLHEEKWRGLQTDFMFEERTSQKGNVNIAVRRLIYNQDLKITLL